MMREQSQQPLKLGERAIFSKAVGYEIYLLRKRRLLTGKKLAELLNISQQQISRYERGVCNITIDMLILVLTVLDMPIDEFISRTLVRISALKFEHGYVSKDIFFENNKISNIG
ncbi:MULTISPECIES: helix-turn-helix domain-containing protein [Providencia]|uniref:helix-turn-helix domain-containing protein n=1 Tax=Providencia TaxID=586 RepID=UPI0024B1E1A1|nr:helix-turn-helix transcriptional regulator [Providencia sp. 2023EL-00965]MDW7590918.1 helix-turn-helix transcriptional regulator [Providencia sp. 2023EL-00965]